jgi:hypothetical protein
MIELKDEQIENEYEKYSKEFESDGEIQFDYLDLESSYNFANSIVKSLMVDQIKQLVESKGMYCGERIKFDADDESTWPKSNKWYLSNLGLVYVAIIDGEIYINTMQAPEDNESWFITYLLEVPEFKEKPNV